MAKYFSKITFISSVLIILLSACNSKIRLDNYMFNGEGVNWQAKLEIANLLNREKNSIEHVKTFSLIYKGNKKNLGKIKSLKYKYEGPTNKASMSLVSPITKQGLTLKSHSTGAFKEEDSIIKVEVEWDGHKEVFDLKIK